MEGKTKANAAKEKENKDRSSKMVIVKNLIENGKKNDPRISTLIKIADYFNISLDELIGRKLEN